MFLDDPSFMGMVQTFVLLIIGVGLAWNQRRFMRKILARLPSESSNSAATVAAKPEPEPDPLANIPKEKLALWASMGLIGSDCKGSPEQLEKLRALGLLDKVAGPVANRESQDKKIEEKKPFSEKPTEEQKSEIDLTEGVKSALEKAAKR